MAKNGTRTITAVITMSLGILCVIAGCILYVGDVKEKSGRNTLRNNQQDEIHIKFEKQMEQGRKTDEKLLGVVHKIDKRQVRFDERQEAMVKAIDKLGETR